MKYLNENRPITDIYIYYTKKMHENCKNALEATIENLYNGLKYNINSYPKKDKLRDIDVQKFGSYYNEINQMYTDVIDVLKSEEIQDTKNNIIVNVASGTSGFKSDIMVMAVTNNLIIEQTSNFTPEIKNALIEAINENTKDNPDNNYKEYLKLYESDNNSVSISSLRIDKINNLLEKDNFKIKLKFLNQIENYMFNNSKTKELSSRSRTEDISTTKKIILYESIKDSLVKKDYAGIYYSILKNSKYLRNNKDKLLKLSKDLYYRYIGDDEKAVFDENETKKLLSNNIFDYLIKENPQLLKEEFPIFEIDSENIEELKEINFIIEKFNILKTKSKREELNDWLLITTPLLETISRKVLMRKNIISSRGFDFNKILDGTKISLQEFDKNYKNDNQAFKIRECIINSEKSFLNAIFYKNILIELCRQNVNNKSDIIKILSKIFIIDCARLNRVDAAHTIKNVNNLEFENSFLKELNKLSWISLIYSSDEYKNRFNMEQTKKKSLQQLWARIRNEIDNECKEIFLEKERINRYKMIITTIEREFLELINILTDKKNNLILNNAVNKFEDIENQIIQLFKEEIYGKEMDSDE